MGQSRTLRFNHFQNGAGISWNYFDAIHDNGVVEATGIFVRTVGFLGIDTFDGAHGDFRTGWKRNTVWGSWSRDRGRRSGLRRYGRRGNGLRYYRRRRSGLRPGRGGRRSGRRSLRPGWSRFRRPEPDGLNLIDLNGFGPTLGLDANFLCVAGFDHTRDLPAVLERDHVGKRVHTRHRAAQPDHNEITT